MGSRLRYHRKNSGLTQRDLAEILGFVGARQIAKHEVVQAVPSIIAAIGYQVIFCTSIAELFPGMYETIRDGVEQRLVEFEQRLHQSTATGYEAELIARKLVWLEERRSKAMPRTSQ